MLTITQRHNTSTEQNIVNVLLLELMHLSMALTGGHRIITNQIVITVSRLQSHEH